MKTIKNMTADQLRKSILQLAIQGKLVKQDPKDEPASVLVDKIYEEKKKLIAEGKIKKEKVESRILKGDDNRYYEKIGKETKDITNELPFEIPESWEWIRLENLTNFYLGKTPDRHNAKYWEEPLISWVSIADMIDKKEIFYSKEKISKLAFNQCFNKQISKAGTLIMSFKLTVGKVSLLGIDAVHNEAIISIYPYISTNNTTKIYLFNLLGLLVKYCEKTDAIKGSTLNKEKLSKMLIPLPPLNEQQLIIDWIKQIEPLLQQYDKLEKQLTKLENEITDKLKKSILQYAIEGKLVKQDPNDEPASVLLERIKAEKEKLIKEEKIKRDKNESYIYQGDDKNYYEKIEVLHTIPRSWKFIKLSYVIDVARGGSPRPIQDYLTTSKDGYNWIKIGDANINSKYIESTKEKIKKEGLYKTKLVHPGDFLLTNSMSFGHPYILKIDGCIHDGWLVLSDKFEVYNKDFLYYLLSSPYIYKSFCSTAGGSVVKNLNSDKVAETIIPLLSIREQTKIANKINLLFGIITNY